MFIVHNVNDIDMQILCIFFVIFCLIHSKMSKKYIVNFDI